MTRRWWVLATFSALGAVALSGCAQVSYLAQAAVGQARLLLGARPLQEVIADPATPAETRRQLLLAQDVRRYAVDALGLPDNRTFTTYTELNRPYLVWNVFTAPALSSELRTYCFPIAGCVPYRGYFSLAGAEREAALKRAVREAEAALDTQAYTQYPKLTEGEVKRLVVDDKWMASLEVAVHGELDRITQALTRRLRELAERYEAPLPEMAARVGEMEGKVAAHLARMGFSWN